MIEAKVDQRTFVLDFSDGRCRLANHKGLEHAVSDALSAAEATHTPCKVLEHETLKCVGEVRLRHDRWTWEVRQ